MTPNMKIEYGGEDDGSHMQAFHYTRDPNFATYGDSDLAQRDYGAMSIQQLPPQPPIIRNIISPKQSTLYDEKFQ